MLYHKLGDAAKDYVMDNNALILQISNCISCKIHNNSFGGSLYNSLPYSSPYINRKPLYPFNNLAKLEHRDKPGTIKFKFPLQNSKNPIVCCLFGQYDMGDGTKKYFAKSKYIDSEYLYMIKRDTKKDRFEYFKACLNQLVLELKSPSICNINKIIIPKFMGCGLGGGNWGADYYPAITEFSENCGGIDIIIVEKK